MQPSYRQFLLTASSDTDFISFGAYSEYIKTVESTGGRGPLQRGAPCHGTIGTMVNPPLLISFATTLLII